MRAVAVMRFVWLQGEILVLKVYLLVDDVGDGRRLIRLERPIADDFRPVRNPGDRLCMLNERRGDLVGRRQSLRFTIEPNQLVDDRHVHRSTLRPGSGGPIWVPVTGSVSIKSVACSCS